MYGITTDRSESTMLPAMLSLSMLHLGTGQGKTSQNTVRIAWSTFHISVSYSWTMRWTLGQKTGNSYPLSLFPSFELPLGRNAWTNVLVLIPNSSSAWASSPMAGWKCNRTLSASLCTIQSISLHMQAHDASVTRVNLVSLHLDARTYGLYMQVLTRTSSSWHHVSSTKDAPQESWRY